MNELKSLLNTFYVDYEYVSYVNHEKVDIETLDELPSMFILMGDKKCDIFIRREKWYNVFIDAGIYHNYPTGAGLHIKSGPGEYQITRIEDYSKLMHYINQSGLTLEIAYDIAYMVKDRLDDLGSDSLIQGLASKRMVKTSRN